MKAMNVKVIIVTALVILALVLGGLVADRWRSSQKTDGETAVDLPIGTLQSKETSPREFPRFLTAVEISVLNTPTASTSAEDRQKHFDIAIRLARSADTLIIKDCFSTPTVLQIVNNQTLKIQNSDNTKHVLSFDKNMRFEIAANTTKEFKISVPKDGLYGYACDYHSKATGLMLISDK